MRYQFNVICIRSSSFDAQPTILQAASQRRCNLCMGYAYPARADRQVTEKTMEYLICQSTSMVSSLFRSMQVHGEWTEYDRICDARTECNSCTKSVNITYFGKRQSASTFPIPDTALTENKEVTVSANIT